MAYDNIKSHKKPGFLPLFRRYICEGEKIKLKHPPPPPPPPRPRQVALGLICKKI